MSSSDPELFVYQVGNLSSSKETVLFVGFLFLQTDSPFELGIMNDFVQCRSNPRIKNFKIRHWNITNRWRRPQFIHRINQLHFLDPLHRLRRKLSTSTSRHTTTHFSPSKTCCVLPDGEIFLTRKSLECWWIHKQQTTQRGRRVKQQENGNSNQRMLHCSQHSTGSFEDDHNASWSTFSMVDGKMNGNPNQTETALCSRVTPEE